MLEEHLNQLGQKIRGTVITPSNGEYEAARKVYNGMIDRRPAAIGVSSGRRVAQMTRNNINKKGN
jgi:hypothetical protein